jgi:hypothetical protein
LDGEWRMQQREIDAVGMRDGRLNLLSQSARHLRIAMQVTDIKSI